MNGLKNFGWALLGFLSAVAIALIIVGIGCAVNGLTFSEQVVEWFGTASDTVADVVENATDAVVKASL